MDATGFAQELEQLRDERLRVLRAAGASPLAAGDRPVGGRSACDQVKLLQIALVEDRLKSLGFDMASFRPPATNPLFDYLRSLPTSVERVAAGLFALESIACNVNENFMRWCAQRGDEDTVRIYRDFIQPDERAHEPLGAALLRAHATTPERQAKARAAVLRTLEIASALRSRAAERIGTSCFPGC